MCVYVKRCLNMAEEPQESRPIFSPETEEQFLRMMERMFRRTQQIAPGLTVLPEGVVAKWKPSKKDEKTIRQFMELMDSEIKKYAEDLIRFEVRDKIVKKGPDAIPVIKEALKKGKKPKLKRKKGCIYIQFGEGTPEDPIDEILIAST